MKEREAKQVMSRVYDSVRINRKGDRRQIWWMYFVFMCEKRIMKLVEIVLRRGRED
jgi:hypothetical protein